MAAYKDLIGQKITKVTSNPSEPKTGQMWYNSNDGVLRGLAVFEAWSSGSPMSRSPSNHTLGGCGTPTAGLGFGGYTAPGGTVGLTEEWNGSGWSAGGAMNTPEAGMGSFGTQTAAVSAGGTPNSAVTEEYNGTSWTTGNAMGTGRGNSSSAGTETSGLVAGGNNPPIVGNVEEYNGTSWSEQTDLGTSRYQFAGCGAANTAAVVFGGSTPGDTGATEEYDGSSWTAGGSLNTGRRRLAASGIQTAALGFGGNTTPPDTTRDLNEAYNGTSWSASPATLSAAKTALGSTKNSSSNTNAVAFAGTSTSTPLFLTTEVFNKTTTVTTAGAWSSTNNQNTTAYGRSACGTQTAGLVFGGYGPSVSHATTETYDGSSFTEVADLSTARRYAAGFGLQTAAVMCGGNTPPGRSDAVEEWNGSAWGNNPNALPAANSSLTGAGTSTAGLVFGGNTGSGGASTGNTQTFDGTSFSEVADLNTSRYSVRGAGTQTAALCTGGKTGPSTHYNSTESWDGSSWTAVANFPSTIQRGAQSTASNTSALYAGGSTADASTGVVATSALYNGTIWVSQPSMGTARSYMAGFGTSTAMVGCGGYGSGFPAPSRNQAEEFTGETTAVNIADFTTS